MNYYKVVIRQIPQIVFAHSYSTNSYHLYFPRKKRFIEISCLEQGDVVKTMNTGEEQFIKTPSFCVNFFTSEFSIKSDAPLHQHTTVGIEAEYDLQTVTEEEILKSYRLNADNKISAQPNCVTAILPDYGSLNQQNSDIEKLIKQIALTHISPSATRGIHCAGLLFNLLLKITEDSIRNVISEYSQSLAPSGLLYVRRAMQYISEHLDQKITIEEIAGSLEISCGYLSHLFKTVTGQTIIEYINKLKIAKVKELILTKNATLKQAAESVGIFDENYLSRIFKKYTGINVREFKMLELKHD